MATITYQTLTPFGKADNLYLSFVESDLLTLQNDINAQNVITNTNYTNNYINNSSGVPVSYLISRTDPTQKFQYNNFTPNNQTVPITKNTDYTIADGVPYVTCCANRLSNSLNSSQPEILPQDCVVSQLVSAYPYPVSEV